MVFAPSLKDRDLTHLPDTAAGATRRRCLQSVCLAAFAASLAACATPTYPTDSRGTQAAAARTEPAPAVTPTPAPVLPPPAPAVRETTIPAPAPAAVESQSLPPPSGQAAESRPSEPPPVAYSPPAYAPPAPREVTRTVAGGEVVKATRMYRDYVVRKGDHLDAIARDFDVAAEDLSEANHLKSPDSLRPGQHLKIPVAKAYVAQSGDTLAAVAKRFDLSAQDLADLNDLGVRDRLRSGDRLALPANFHDRGPTKVTETVYARQDRYRAPHPRDDQPLPRSGVYTPSPAALEAARERAAGVASPTPTAPYHAYADTGSRYAPVIGRPAGEAAPMLTDAQVAAAGKGRFVWPVRGETLVKFGAQGVGRRNDGLDLRSPQGTVVRAAAAGEVVYAGNQVPGFGNLVLVKHADGWVTAYAHLEHASVAMRQTVMQGQPIGDVGTSGGAPEPELHFEVRYAAAPTDKAKPIDPMLVLPQ
jgi:murein DD-endopeptidase MepM/ murein hydrolase activator NlpD